MYRAKVNGKSRWEIFDSAMHAQVTERLEMESALRRALEQREFRVYFQPIVDVSSKNAVGLEALLRWERPSYWPGATRQLHSNRRRVRLDHGYRRVGLA